jgi:pimeloyl-ACP methyl ester carboxylesterase
MSHYQDVYYSSPDGLQLYARDYPADQSATGAPQPTLLCMHGLTRNSRDFEPLAAALAGRYRMVVVDQRGRGLSAYDDNSANYQPITYVGDMFALIAQLGLKEIVLIGTSMGGLMAMMMAAMQPALFRGLVINDIAPEIEPAGLERIKAYVGRHPAHFDDWQAAVSSVRDSNGEAFPHYSDEQWLAFTRRLCHSGSDGKIYYSYDAAIAEPMLNTPDSAVPPDLWPLFGALKALPMLTVHGALSDILSDRIVSRMQQEHPTMRYSRVDNVGHAPILDEPEALTAIEQFLASL